MTTVHYSNLEDRYWIKDDEDRILWFDSVLEAQDYAQAMKLKAAAMEERAKIVAWLRKDSRLCDCFAREEGECACGAWYDDKKRQITDVADDIEAGEHLK